MYKYYVVLSILSIVYGHNCIHDRISKEFHGENGENLLINHNVNYQTDTVKQGRRLMTGSFAPIRFRLDFSRLTSSLDNNYACRVGDASRGAVKQFSDGKGSYSCRREDELTPEKDTYLRNILQDAADWWAESLSINRVVGNLVLGNPGSCSNRHYMCCSEQMPPADYSSGHANTDYIFYVTARPTGSTVLAWALACQADSKGRPIAGHINFSPASISIATRDRNRQFSTALHEMAHALAFSRSLFSSFRNPATGNPWGESNVVQDYIERGAVVTKIVTPTVTSKAKELFSCSSFTNAGLEVETYGGSGSAGSHWEKRLVNNEFMSSTISMNPVRSALTLALFEDSGWYSVNYAQAEGLPWGFEKGCTFTNSKCDAWDSSYFCSTSGKRSCTVDRLAKGYCNRATYSSALPVQYRYFGDSVSGGGDPFSDYCPYYQGYGNGDCRDLGYSPTSVSSSLKEAIGDSSRCFLSTNDEPACYPTRCDGGGDLWITVGGQESMCPRTGGRKTINGISVLCPHADSICDLPELYCNDGKGCSGAGTCSSNGICVCFSGRTGSGCEQRVCPKTPQQVECNTGQVCANSGSTGCCNRTTGTCQCLQGWAGLACEEKLCPSANEGLCSGHGSCVDGECQCDDNYSGVDCSNVPGCVVGGVCQGNSNGFCDTTTGACACIEGQFGVDCQTNIPPPVEELVVQVGNVSFVSGTVESKGFTYFEAPINGSLYDITVIVKTLSGDADVYVMYTNQDSSSVFPTTRRSTWSSTKSGTEQIEIVQICGNYDFFPRGEGDRLCTQSDQSFTLDQATLRIGVLGFQYQSETTFEIAVEQDACVKLGENGCGRGNCVKGKCICLPLWTGNTCDIPDCPGTPDCNNHGACLVLEGNLDPECVCSFGFDGDDCGKLAEGFENPPIYLPIGGTPELANAVNGSILAATGSGNWSYFELDVPKNASEGIVTMYVSVVERMMDQCDVLQDPRIQSEGCGRGDALIMAQREVLPVLNEYAMIDSESWSTARDTHSFVLDSTTGFVGGKWYIGILNTAYAKSRLFYDLTIDTVKRCSSVLSCNGNGSCNENGDSFQPVCVCNPGFAGDQCQYQITAVDATVLIDDVEVYESTLEPGEWRYFSVHITNENLLGQSNVAPRELLVQLESLPRVGENEGVVSSYSNQPILVVSTDSNVPTLSSAGLIDYDSWSSKSRNQQVVVRQPELKSKSYYIGVHNRHYATTVPLNVELSITLRQPINDTIYYECRPEGDETKEPCYGLGTCVLDESVNTPKCFCQSGWSGALCNSPALGAISGVQAAAQNISNLCNTCTTTLSLNRNEYKLFRIPQPLQRNQGIRVRVTGDTEEDDADIFVSEQLPRSAYDFVYVAAMDGQEETILLDEVSSSGRYFLAVYAKSKSNYDIIVERVFLVEDETGITDGELVNEVRDWLLKTPAGKAVFGMMITICLVIILVALSVICKTNALEKTRRKFGSLLNIPVAETVN